MSYDRHIDSGIVLMSKDCLGGSPEAPGSGTRKDWLPAW